MEVCAKNVTYIFPEDEIYKTAMLYASEEIADIYDSNSKEAYEEYQEMLKNGEVSSLGEYNDIIGGDYLIEADGAVQIAPYDPNEYVGDIEKKIQVYLKNYYELPDDIVLDAPQDIKEMPVSLTQVNEAAKAKYGFEVNAFMAADKALKKDLAAVKMNDGFNNMLNSSDYSTLIQLRANIRRYSLSNVAMIYCQNPDAIDVKGYNAMLDIGRRVKAGEHGIDIWCPNVRQEKILKTEEQINKYVNSEYYNCPESYKDRKKYDLTKKLKEDGQVKIPSSIRGYSIGTVFDITQTEAVLTSEKAIDAWIKRNVKDSAEAASMKADMLDELKKSETPKIKVGKKFLSAVYPPYDSLDNVVELQKPLDKDMNNFEEIKAVINRAFGEYSSQVSYDGVSEQEKLYNAISDYAEYRLAKDPSGITGIKSKIPATGLTHRIEVLCATAIICETVGIDCAAKINVELAETMEKQNFTSSKESFMEGRMGVFQKGFDRATKLADEFIKEFDKQYDLQLDKSVQNQKKNKSSTKANVDKSL